jgi:general secretion pathway protein N
MRALALLIGFILIGNGEALALNASLTVDTQTTDPVGDLFASKPVSAAPAAALSAAPSTISAPIPTPERVPNGSPLWAIPLSSLTATREQPMFAPSRRPPPVATLARPAAAPALAPPAPPQPEKPQLSLLGTVAGTGEKIGLFLDSASKAVLRLKAGENHQGWTLRAVRPRQVELAKGLDNAVLDLPPPNMTGAAAPPPAAPAQMLVSPPPVSPVLPVGTTTASGMLPSVTPGGTPRTTSNQPPAYVNPFLTPRPR